MPTLSIMSPTARAALATVALPPAAILGEGGPPALPPPPVVVTRSPSPLRVYAEVVLRSPSDSDAGADTATHVSVYKHADGVSSSFRWPMAVPRAQSAPPEPSPAVSPERAGAVAPPPVPPIPPSHARRHSHFSQAPPSLLDHVYYDLMARGIPLYAPPV